MVDEAFHDPLVSQRIMSNLAEMAAPEMGILMPTTYITELSEGDRKSVEKETKMLPSMMHSCESYLKDYPAGTQTAFKFVNTMRWVHDEAEGLINLIAEKHGTTGFRSIGPPVSDSRWRNTAELLADTRPKK
jgi:hypothetical protein